MWSWNKKDTGLWRWWVEGTGDLEHSMGRRMKRGRKMRDENSTERERQEGWWNLTPSLLPEADVDLKQMLAVICWRTLQAYLILLHFTGTVFFTNWSFMELSKSVNAFFPKAFGPFGSLCHISVILTVLQALSLLLYFSWWSVISDLAVLGCHTLCLYKMVNLINAVCVPSAPPSNCSPSLSLSSSLLIP